MDSVHMKYDVPWVFSLSSFGSSLCSVCVLLLFTFRCLYVFVILHHGWCICDYYYVFLFFAISLSIAAFSSASQKFFFFLKKSSTRTLTFFALDPAYNQRSFYVNLFAFEYDCGKKKIERTHTHTSHTHRETDGKTVEKMREMLIAPCTLSFLILFSLDWVFSLCVFASNQKTLKWFCKISAQQFH